MPIVPFKLNQDRRHHIPRQRRKVTNWPAYDASLRQRGSLTVWFTDEAIRAWKAEPRTTRGGQPWYSELAILTALTLRAVFRLAYRQTEGLIASVIRLLGLTLPVPDHTTLSRRAATLEVPRPRSSSRACTPASPSAILRPLSSCRHARRRCRAGRLRVHRPRGTAISSLSPSRAAWDGRKPPGI